VRVDGWSVPQPAKFLPDTDAGIDWFCRLILPARILRKVAKERPLEGLTNQEEIELMCAVSWDSYENIPLEQRRPEWWVGRTLWALQKTGHINRTGWKGSYLITPEGKAWLKKVNSYDPTRVHGTEVE
jgi:hypothetical protein